MVKCYKTLQNFSGICSAVRSWNYCIQLDTHKSCILYRLYANNWLSAITITNIIGSLFWNKSKICRKILEKAYKFSDNK